MNYAIKTLAIRVVMLAVVVLVVTINIQTAAAATYLTEGTIDGIRKGTTDGMDNAREKTATVLGFHQKLSNNCSGFEVCTNTATTNTHGR
ncbi:MAG TPA: hypothetical protein VE622_01310 [Nitrososphaeraceae archaeon]|jgi:hypothetical protein|nr:hypothetical protein [Nitrososphaeraceae archaeon]